MSKHQQTALALLAFAASLLSRCATAQPHCAEVLQPPAYSWLEQNTPERTAWILSQNRSTLLKFKSQNLLPAMQAMIKKAIDLPGVYNQKVLQDKSKIFISDPGLGKDKELVIVKPSGEREVLLHSFQWKKNSTFNFVDLSLSPSQRYVTVTVTENGTIDDFQVILYDLQTRQIIRDDLTTISTSKISWPDDNTFLLKTQKYQTYSFKLMDGKLSIGTATTERYLGDKDGVHLFVDYQAKVTTLRQKGQSDLLIAQTNFESVVGVDGADIYLSAMDSNGWGSVYKITRATTGEAAEGATQPILTTIIPETNWVLSSKQLAGRFLLMQKYLGAARKLEVFDLEKNLSYHVDLPGNLGVNSVLWAEVGEKLRISFSSPVIGFKTYTYDLKLGHYLEGDPNSEMMMKDGISYVTEYFQVPSADQKLVPVRIVRRKDMAMNSTAGALISVYGGFGQVNGLHPRYDYLNFEFLKRGGILVFPGIRGGKELGEPWHLDGMKGKKQNGLNDINATAEFLKNKNYVDPKKTVLTGWSNGGLMSAAAALQRPDLYGLVIPGNGVHDYLNTQQLDARFNGWKSEYGDASTQDLEYMKLISPLELAKKNLAQPRFLIMNGRLDSRVNPAHSYKLTQVLLEHAVPPEQISLISINNSGHWMTSQRYQDLIGWRALSLMWTEIYATVGLTP